MTAPKCPTCGRSAVSLPELDQSGAPDGYELRWSPERDPRWGVVDGKPESVTRRCRWGGGGAGGRPACGQPSVVKLDRGRRQVCNWWHYCGEHMYGRVLVDGVIYTPVLRRIGEAS